MLVLLAEDDAISAFALERWLRRNDVDVVVAPNGQSAWVAFQQAPIDLLISDLNMPLLSGAELVRLVRAVAPRLPIILVSGQTSDITSLLVSAGEPIQFFTKPVDPVMVMAAIDMMVKTVT